MSIDTFFQFNCELFNSKLFVIHDRKFNRSQHFVETLKIGWKVFVIKANKRKKKSSFEADKKYPM